MSEELKRAIEAVKKEWKLEEKIQASLLSLQEKEQKRAEEIIFHAKKEAEAILEDAKKTGNQLIQDAEVRSEFIFAQKKKELQKLEEDKKIVLEKKQKELDSCQKLLDEKLKTASEDGYQSGFSKGYEEGMSQFTGLIHSVSALVEDLRKKNEILFSTQTEFIQKFVFLYVDRVIGPLSESNTKSVFNNISKAMEEVNRATSFKVVVSSSDYKTLVAAESEFRKMFPATAQVELLEDANLRAGGCLLETELGSVDATVESQIALLNQELCHD